MYLLIVSPLSLQERFNVFLISGVYHEDAIAQMSRDAYCPFRTFSLVN